MFITLHKEKNHQTILSYRAYLQQVRKYIGSFSQNIKVEVISVW